MNIYKAVDELREVCEDDDCGHVECETGRYVLGVVGEA